MDSSTAQQYRWAADRFGIEIDSITNLWFDSYTSDLGGCETCGPEYETTHTVYVNTTNGTHSADFTDVFSMIREFCAA